MEYIFFYLKSMSHILLDLVWMVVTTRCIVLMYRQAKHHVYFDCCFIILYYLNSYSKLCLIECWYFFSIYLADNLAKSYKTKRVSKQLCSNHMYNYLRIKCVMYSFQQFEFLNELIKHLNIIIVRVLSSPNIIKKA